jgi:hypothetical protein
MINSRPRFEVTSNMNTAEAIASGSQPPCGIFAALALKKASQ